jgi:predicted ATPase
MFPGVFISYSSKDKPVADDICVNLEAAGIRCWIAPRDIAPGEDWPTAIARAIAQSRVMILVFSASSNSSEDVGRELFLAANSKLVIVPFKIEDIEPEPGKQYYLARTNWLEAINPPTQEQIRALLDCVKGFVPVREPSPVIEVRPTPPANIDRPIPGNNSPQSLLKTLNPSSNNLPVQLTSFIGREKEIAEVKRLLNEKHLVTITGPGGTGKTRLSLQVAAELFKAFPNGVWLVELAPVADPALVSQAVATALGVREQRALPMQDALTDFLRQKDLLLILDNCEHLVEACAALADTLLHACPGLKILASSREALGIAGEVPFRLPSLSTPDIHHLPPTQVLLQYEAVRLFIERATTALSTFTVTDGNAPAIAQVCQRLDGIPLAIELAAARVRMLSVEQIAARLDDCFRLLTGGSRTALPRLQTLRALIDWSYNLLSASERTLLRRLSVFMGGGTLEASEAICANVGAEAQVRPEEILDILTSLVNKSLVVVQHEQDREPSYRLLETIRQYVLEKLSESGEGESIRNQHLGYFLTLAERAEREMHAAGQKAWFDRLEEERDNFRAALRWSLESGEAGAQAGLRLAGSLWWFWYIRTYWNEGVEWLERTLTLSASQVPADLATRAKALCMLGRLKTFDEARMEEGLALARTLGPAGRQSLAFAFWNLGVCVYFQADYIRANSLEEQGLKLFRELGDRWGICETLTSLGMTNIALGDYQQAAVLLEESLSLARQTRDENEIGFALWRLGELAVAREDYGKATALYEESLAQYKEIKNYSGITLLLWELGNAAIHKGDTHQATSCYKEALAQYWESGHEYGISMGLEHLALAAVARKQPERAAMLLGAAEALRESSGEARFSILNPEDESCLKALRPQLAEATLAALWAEGRAMTVKQAVAYALDETPS